MQDAGSRRFVHRGRASPPRALVLAFACVLGLGAPAGAASREVAVTDLTPSSERTLEVAPRRFGPEEVHAYRAALTPGVWRVLVTQRGVDVVSDATLAESPSLGPFDGPTGRRGTETFSIVVERPVTARLTIEPAASGAGGEYSLAIERIASSPSSRSRWVQAEAAATRAARAVAEGSAENARPHYRRALELWPADERAGRARILGALAVLAAAAEDAADAVALHRRALALWRALGHRDDEATTLNRLGLAVDRLGDSVAARRYFEQALALWNALEDPAAGLPARLNLCLMLQRQGEFRGARGCYETARAEVLALDQPQRLTVVLNNLAGVHWKLGDTDRALALYDEVLERLAQASDPNFADRERRAHRPLDSLRAKTLSNRAVLLAELGEPERALLAFGEALDSFRRLEQDASVARTLGNLGTTYLALGELDRARIYLEQALALFRAADDARSVAGVLRGLGTTADRLGDSARAIDAFTEALALSRTLDDRRGEATLRALLGQAHATAGSLPRAVAGLERAAALQRELGDRRQEAGALLALGQALHQQGATDAAVHTVGRALTGLRTVRDRVGEVRALEALARIERDLGRLDAAFDAATRAADLLEDLRTRVGGLRPRASFLAARRGVYELLVDLLMTRHHQDPAAGYDRDAFAVSERSRARTLLDSMARAESRDRQALDPDATRRVDQATRRLAARVARQMEILNRVHDEDEAIAADREVVAALTALEAARATIRAPSDHEHEAGPSTAADASRLLEPGTLLLELFLAEPRSVLWTIDHETLVAVELPGRREIEALARRAHEDLSTIDLRTGRTSRRALEALGRLVLEPVAERVQSARRLVVVADGALHYVPFAALPAPGTDEPLVASHEVVHLPSASTLHQLRRREPPARATKALAVLADPVFDRRDPRLAIGPDARVAAPEAEPQPTTDTAATDTSPIARLRGALGPLGRLGATAEEARALAALVDDPSQRLVATGVDAHRGRVLSGELADYRYLHFATHGVLNARHPDLSGLVLALYDAAGRPRDGFLSLDDVQGLSLRAELVVLSGCQTALGRELRGEGLVGLSRGFLTAGAPRLVASLWPVHDDATAHLMGAFYRGMLEEKMPPARALAEAQRTLQAHGAWSDPFFWSAFVLIGEWR